MLRPYDDMGSIPGDYIYRPMSLPAGLDSYEFIRELVPSRDLPNWEKAYYGENLARLMQVKRKYDSRNLFAFQQSIPSA